VPRYLVERVWDDLDEEEMNGAGSRSRRIAEERFPEITWEHSHVVTDEAGAIKTFCVYQAPNPDMIREHAYLLGNHQVNKIYEIGGDITPGDFPL
jgi:hypothetical protein